MSTEDLPFDFAGYFVALHEQNRADAAAWWRNSSADDKQKVLDLIVRDYEDPAMEAMSRLALTCLTILAKEDLNL
jgi:hypothetical protein